MMLMRHTDDRARKTSGAWCRICLFARYANSDPSKGAPACAARPGSCGVLVSTALAGSSFPPTFERFARLSQRQAHSLDPMYWIGAFRPTTRGSAWENPSVADTELDRLLSERKRPRIAEALAAARRERQGVAESFPLAGWRELP